MNTPLIRLVDDDEALRDSFALLLETMGWKVASYGDGRSFLEKDTLEGPGCIVLDMRMPGMMGLEVQAELVRRGSMLPVLFLSAHGTISIAVQAVSRGAVDFLEKPVKPLEFIQKVSKAVTASVEALSKKTDEERRLEKFAALTPRERDVVAAVLEGAQNKVAARSLGLEVSTIKMHRANAFAKLGVHSQSELIRLAFEAGVTAATLRGEAGR